MLFRHAFLFKTKIVSFFQIQRMREMMRQMEAKIRNQNGPQINGRVGNV